MIFQFCCLNEPNLLKTDPNALELFDILYLTFFGTCILQATRLAHFKTVIKSHGLLKRTDVCCQRRSYGCWKPLTIITKHSILDVAAALDPSLVVISHFNEAFSSRKLNFFFLVNYYNSRKSVFDEIKQRRVGKVNIGLPRKVYRCFG